MNNVGGLIGGTQTYDPTITNIAAVVHVTGTGTSVGGLIGALMEASSLMLTLRVKYRQMAEV